MPLPLDVLPKVMVVIDRLREGTTLWKACRDAGISRQAVVAHIRMHEELQVEFDKAIEDSDDALAEMLVDIDQVHADPKMATVVSKNIQWLISRRRPAKYGDRITVSNEGGSADKAIVEVLRMAMERVPIPEHHVSRDKILELVPLSDDEELKALQ